MNTDTILLVLEAKLEQAQELQSFATIEVEKYQNKIDLYIKKKQKTEKKQKPSS